MKELGLRVQHARITKGLTQQQLAQKADVSIGYVRNLEQGIRGSRASATHLLRVAKILGVSTQSLTGEVGKPDGNAIEVPVLGFVAAGIGEDERFEPGTFINVPDRCQGADAAYIVRGMSMNEVGILDGDYLFVRTNPTPAPGSMVVAFLRDRGNVVKRLEVVKGVHILHSADGRTDPRYPYTMGEGDRFWGQLVASFRTYDVKSPKVKKGWRAMKAS